MRIGINGFGRMGRLFARAAWDRTGLDVVHVNEPKGGPETAAHLLEFDSVHGRWAPAGGVVAAADALTLGGTRVGFSAFDHPEAVDWGAAGVDLVVDASGKFKTTEEQRLHIGNGAKKVMVAAPVKTEGALNLVYGVNHHLYDPDVHDIITAASCTTNCLAPVVKVVHETFGIERGSITTIHDVTNTQILVDAPHKDLRRARSALTSLIPTTTGSATAITLIYPELAGKLNGHAVRVPLLNASLTDCVFELSKPTTAEAANAAFKAAAEAGPLAGVLGYEDRPLVSVDYVNDPRSGVVDAGYTMVVDGTHLKVYAWYDNEWGYVNRMADLAAMVADAL
jgi:glyceraldehyde 3-phosphate dehydrogenase